MPTQLAHVEEVAPLVYEDEPVIASEPAGRTDDHVCSCTARQRLANPGRSAAWQGEYQAQSLSFLHLFECSARTGARLMVIFVVDFGFVRWARTAWIGVRMNHRRSDGAPQPGRRVDRQRFVDLTEVATLGPPSHALREAGRPDARGSVNMKAAELPCSIETLDPVLAFW